MCCHTNRSVRYSLLFFFCSNSELYAKHVTSVCHLFRHTYLGSVVCTKIEIEVKKIPKPADRSWLQTRPIFIHIRSAFYSAFAGTCDSRHQFYLVFIYIQFIKLTTITRNRSNRFCSIDLY